jgi:hypothetical protein
MSDVISALLMMGYPILVGVLSFSELQALASGPARILLLVCLEIVGILVLICVVARWRWWSLFAASCGFVIALFAFRTANGFEVFFYAALTLVILVGQSSPVHDSYSPPGAAQRSKTTRESDGLRGHSMPVDESKLEVLKYELEREKFLWQKTAQEADRSIVNRHIGVIITAIVSVSAIAVSYAQLNISSTNAKAQLDNEKLRSDRQFYLEAARFMLVYEQDLKSDDVERLRYFRDVVISAFPSDMAAQIMTTMRDTSPKPAARAVWTDGLLSLRRKVEQSRLPPGK